MINLHGVSGSEGDDETWEFFPCPFCYVDVEVPVLCNHLQEEHCFDIKNAVCPVCAANSGRDLIGHFLSQHSHMLKGRKCRRTSVWDGNTATIQQERHEFVPHHGAASTNRWRKKPDSSPDPLLSPFICSTTYPGNEDRSEACRELDPGVSSTSLYIKSSNLSMPKEVSGKEYEERNLRANFVQQVLLSTMY